MKKSKEKNIFDTALGKKADYTTKHGVEVYRRSLTVLLQSALEELYPGLKLQVGQTIMHGYLFEPESSFRLPDDFLRKTTAKMKEMVKKKMVFSVKEVSRDEALDMFSRAGRHDKARAACWLKRERLKLVFAGRYFDFMFLDCVAHAGVLGSFRLLRYKKGFVLQYPGKSLSEIPKDADRQEKLFRVYEETKKWNSILGVHHAPDLNRTVETGQISELIKVQEAFHEKKIAKIADCIKENQPQKNFVFISGPSSSGKTTFVKRLAVQLKVNGLVPQTLHLDDYFLPRSKTPRTPDGELDFETVKAMDIELFKKQMRSLSLGRPVFTPDFDFKTGKRKTSGNEIRIVPGTVILVEGIHGLNPLITGSVKETNQMKIFVSALTQLCIDYNSRIFTSDSRLMRRIIRDSMFRNHSASETLKRFPLVRHGEEKYVFPYQDRAEIFFNSSLIYEQAVLKPMLEKLLIKIKASRSVCYYEARRLLNYLEFFLPVPADEIPSTSIIREFIGSSGFQY